MGTLALIGLGSNLGDRKATLDDAVAALAGMPGITPAALSPYHETRAIGGPGGQGGYLNAAVLVRTSLGPHALLELLHEIECRAGRARDVRWGARTLDLDLLLHGETFLDEPLLKIPHPRLGVRRFVLAPAVEIAPLVVDVSSGLTIAQLLANLDRRPSSVAIDGPESLAREYLYRSLIRELGATPIDAVSEPGDYFDRAFQAAQIRPSKGPAAGRGDDWLISDKSPLAGGIAGEIRPTFAVALGRIPPRNSGFPWIRPESMAPDALVNEVLAACAASRGG